MAAGRDEVSIFLGYCTTCPLSYTCFSTILVFKIVIFIIASFYYYSLKKTALGSVGSLRMSKIEAASFLQERLYYGASSQREIQLKTSWFRFLFGCLFNFCSRSGTQQIMGSVRRSRRPGSDKSGTKKRPAVARSSSGEESGDEGTPATNSHSQ